MLKYFFCSIMAVSLMTGCSTGPQPIGYGKENCELCKMTIMDHHFATELITKKGKVFKFDDVHCLLEYVKVAEVNKAEVKAIYLMDYAVPGNFILADSAYLIKSDQLKTPMEGHIAAFRFADSMTHYLQKLPGVQVTWKQLFP